MSSEKEQLEQVTRELASLRRLVRDALNLTSPPDFDPDDEGSEDYERYEILAEGYEMAKDDFRRVVAPEPVPSSRQAMLDRTAVNVGLEPGGPCTGHLAVLWDTAYEEGRANALTPGPLM